MIFGLAPKNRRPNLNKLQELIDIMTKLIDEHETLMQITSDKTEVIKTSSMDELSQLLILERKQIKLITALEETREELVNSYFYEENLHAEDKTIGTLLSDINDLTIQTELEEKASYLMEIMIKLKQTEQLNHALIEQSKDFVELSLDMLQPSIKEMNYQGRNTKPANQDNGSIRTSMFDSKA